LQTALLKTAEGDARTSRAPLVGARLLLNNQVLLRGCPGEDLLKMAFWEPEKPDFTHFLLVSAVFYSTKPGTSRREVTAGPGSLI